MMMQHTLERLNSLRLHGMATALEQQLTSTHANDLSFEERISFIVDSEFTSRESKKITRLLQGAKLKENAMLEDVIYKNRSGLDKQYVASLSLCDWIKNHHNLIITGATGNGKTWLACAFAQQACRNLLSASYNWTPTLLKELEVAHLDGSFRKLLNQLTKLDLVIIDDFGIKPISASAAHDLLEIIDARVNKKSLIITSQYPVENWHSLIGDDTIADALLDRVAHNSHRIKLTGESLRKRKRPLEI
ncbi:IS21-like element helper ATPase IstB [Undibacterium sp. Tian12W]|uniref:IS21-like element helper ATPase IstB n=1 Tax=Undibacterium sp. Tian12W TaxID=3413054 RepID=UPI003BF03EE9